MVLVDSSIHTEYAMMLSSGSAHDIVLRYASTLTRSFTPPTNPAQGCVSVTLTAGDVLYLPERWVHSVDTGTGLQCSVNFGFPSLDMHGKLLDG